MHYEETYMKNLEKFRHYQETLSYLVCDNRIDLDEISHSYLMLDENSALIIRYIPFDGEYVYLTAKVDGNEADIKYELEHLSNADFAELNHILKKCLIIEELRNKT